ncbi:1 3-beta-glucanosyltransferase gel4 [Kickxella alabastrina]|uniref:1 3-beta-glucanosyltransferase gel4 n=1 Tax=Kickxella alabastrina TaxID=61397 RepID=A0ACC1IX97_9FUNG|nr:1 3-beta-glucanosyltransferase gel4 [Kickxella alabastrina]
MRISFASSTAIALGLAAQAAAIDPLVVKGSKWFNKNTGKQFYVKGVDYQPDIILTNAVRDPLADLAGCKRDLPFLKDLGVNAIRVYQTEPFGDHDGCMQLLADAGIYVMLDLSTPTETINRDSPLYDVNLLGYYQQKVDVFSKYDNVFGFLAGNEATNQVNNTDTSAFVKAALRDVKAHIKSKGLSIPVGYATNDDADIRWQLQTYFDCGKAEEQADFYGINLYEWCGAEATFESSGYVDVVKNFTNWDVPVLLTEYGCNLVTPRTFPEVAAIYGKNMTNIFSGGFVYEYVAEDNNYGLVTVSGTKATKTADYDYFKKALAAVNPSSVSMSSYTPSGKQHSCPSVGASNNWLASSTLPPTPSNTTCECMFKSLKCVSKTDTIPTNAGDLKTFGAKVAGIYDTVCSKTDCGVVTTDGTKGVYGKYSFCDDLQRVSWVMNAWYEEQRGINGSCDFNSFGTVVEASSSDDSKCSDQNNDSSSSSKSSDSKSGSGSSSSDASSKAALSVGAAVIVAAAMIF